MLAQNVASPVAQPCQQVTGNNGAAAGQAEYLASLCQKLGGRKSLPTKVQRQAPLPPNTWEAESHCSRQEWNRSEVVGNMHSQKIPHLNKGAVAGVGSMRSGKPLLVPQ
ncbi:hypothetical protein MY3296_008513 [Beauveria thailandica]